MLVRKSKYDEMVLIASAAQAALAYERKSHVAMIDQWNVLVRKINALGGESFLKGSATSSAQFSQEDIARLIQLCHPDKHDGKKAATDMTAKLLKIKGEKK